MSPLPAPYAEDDWAAEILEDARTQFNGVVTIRMPDAEGSYNPTADVTTPGAAGAVLIQSRPARIQHIGVPKQRDTQDGWSTEQGIRVQFEILPGDPVIRKGALVDVEDGGRDSALESFVFQVIKAFNSSHAALRTVEASTEG